MMVPSDLFLYIAVFVVFLLIVGWPVFTIFRRTSEFQQCSPHVKKPPIGGWLVFLLITEVLVLFLSAYGVFQSINSVKEMATLPKNIPNELVISIKQFVFSYSAIEVAQIVLVGVFVALMLLRNTYLPIYASIWLMINVLISLLLYIAFDTAIRTSYPDPQTGNYLKFPFEQEIVNMILKSFVSAFIWIPYFSRSRRVFFTFFPDLWMLKRKQAKESSLKVAQQ